MLLHTGNDDFITSIKKYVRVVYYESRKRELKIRLMNEGRYDERLKARVEEGDSGPHYCQVYLQQNKKRRKSRVKNVTLKLCEVWKSRYS